MNDEELNEIRKRLVAMGMPLENVSNEAVRMGIIQRGLDFRDNAPLSAADAAKIILDGVRAKRWRILVGSDAEVIDRMVRETPEEAYGEDFMVRLLAETQWDLGS